MDLWSLQINFSQCLRHVQTSQTQRKINMLTFICSSIRWRYNRTGSTVYTGPSRLPVLGAHYEASLFHTHTDIYTLKRLLPQHFIFLICTCCTMYLYEKISCFLHITSFMWNPWCFCQSLCFPIKNWPHAACRHSVVSSLAMLGTQCTILQWSD